MKKQFSVPSDVEVVAMDSIVKSLLAEAGFFCEEKDLIGRPFAFFFKDVHGHLSRISGIIYGVSVDELATDLLTLITSPLSAKLVDVIQPIIQFRSTAVDVSDRWFITKNCCESGKKFNIDNVERCRGVLKLLD